MALETKLLIPQTPQLATGNPGDLRMADLMRSNYADARIVIVGFPTDVGVRRNGGREGAALAPSAIRVQLAKLCPENSAAFVRTSEAIHDAGDVQCSEDLEKDQQNLGKVVGSILADGKIPIILGGGHETAFGHYLGYEQIRKSIALINIDAHPDVRELRNGMAHSGSPFRQALEKDDGVLDKYSVFGLQAHSVSSSHIDYLSSKNCSYTFRSDWSLDTFQGALRDCRSAAVSFDMDVVDVAFAPGVSAPSINGLSAADCLEIAFAAGASPNVHSYDLVEVNPNFDIDSRTSRLAAVAMWQFIRGVSIRL